MTRSIGDLVAASVGVTCEPEIQVFNCLSKHDKALIIASDGLWDRLDNKEVTRIVMSPQFYDSKDADAAVGLLMNESVARWQKEQGMVDDITIVLAYLNIDPQKQAGALSSGLPAASSNLPVSPPSGADNPIINKTDK